MFATAQEDAAIKESTASYSLLEARDDRPLMQVSDWKQYPGNRRIPMNSNYFYSDHATTANNKDTILLKTGGNALQAVPRSILEQSTSLMSVCVPENARPGQVLWVKTPNNDGRMIEAVVPEGALPGKIFFVEIPPAPKLGGGKQQETPVIVNGSVPFSSKQSPHAAAAAAVVSGRDVGNSAIPADLHLQEVDFNEDDGVEKQKTSSTKPGTSQQQAPGNNATTPTTSNNDNTTTIKPDLILVQVPEGMEAGSTMQIPLKDGRTIEAIIPPNVTEFYVQVPLPENFHFERDFDAVAAVIAFKHLI